MPEANSILIPLNQIGRYPAHILIFTPKKSDCLCEDPYSCHFFDMHLLEDVYEIRTIQELLGHKDVSTTMV
jgi:hypothetical protein